MGGQAIGIGIIGCGTVGSVVAREITENASTYEKLLGRPVKLQRVLTRSPEKALALGFVKAEDVTADPDEFFIDPELEIVVELIGGIDTASEYVKRAIKAGKHVVTANKALLADQGGSLCKLARDRNVSIGYEASCAGGIPVVTALQFGLKANQVENMYGILNGTCNFILTRMSMNGASYEDALREAQAKGFAEADPTLDVGGHDAAQKLAILSTMTYGVSVNESHVQTTGISHLELADIEAGRELGYNLKLIACAEQREGKLSFRVEPCFVKSGSMLGDVSGSFNALSVFGNLVGHTFYYGRGAGGAPTASAVLSDIVNIASDWYPKAFESMKTWLDTPGEVAMMDDDHLMTRYYMRIMAKDCPGVVAQFSGILGEEGVSLAAVMQHEGLEAGHVPVVITTHQTPLGAVRRAADRINQLDTIAHEPVCIRILDMPSG